MSVKFHLIKIVSLNNYKIKILITKSSLKSFFNFKAQPLCYTCGQMCDTMLGNQPPGDMIITKTNDQLAGFRPCTTLSLTYTFKDGEQQVNKRHVSLNLTEKTFLILFY